MHFIGYALSGRKGRYTHAYGICAPFYCISLKRPNWKAWLWSPFCNYFPLFSSLLKNEGRRKGEWFSKNRDQKSCLSARSLKNLYEGGITLLGVLISGDIAKTPRILLYYLLTFQRNVIHGSDSVENAEKEIKLWMAGDEDVVQWKMDAESWVLEWYEPRCSSKSAARNKSCMCLLL